MIKTNGSKAKLSTGLRPKKSSFAFASERIDDQTGKTKIKLEIERRIRANAASISILDQLSSLSKEELQQRKLEAVIEINQLSTQLSVLKLPKELGELFASEKAFGTLLEGFADNIIERIQLEKKSSKFGLPTKRGKGESVDKRRDSYREKSQGTAKPKTEEDAFKRHEQLVDENSRQTNAYFDLLGKIPAVFHCITKEFQFHKKVIETEFIDLMTQNRKANRKLQALQQNLSELQKNLREKSEHINCLHLIIDRLVEENPGKQSQFLRTHGVNTSSKITACSPKNEQSDFLFNPVLEKIKSCPRIQVNIFSEKRKDTQRSSSNPRQGFLPLDTHKENKSVQIRASSFKELNPSQAEKTKRRESVKPISNPPENGGSYELRSSFGLSQQKLKVFKSCNRKFPSFLEATRQANSSNQIKSQQNKNNVPNIQNFDLLSDRQQSMTRRYSSQIVSEQKPPKAFYFKKEGYGSNARQELFDQCNSEMLVPKTQPRQDSTRDINMSSGKFFSPVNKQNFPKRLNLIIEQETSLPENPKIIDANQIKSKVSKRSDEYGIILRSNRFAEKQSAKGKGRSEGVESPNSKEPTVDRELNISIEQQLTSLPSNLQIKEPPIATTINVDYDQNPLQLCDTIKHTPPSSFQNTERQSLIDFEAANNLLGSEDLLPEKMISRGLDGFELNEMFNISFKNFKKEDNRLDQMRFELN